MVEKTNVAVFVSGGGTNLQALIDSERNGRILNGKIELVVSNNKNAYAIQRAKDNNIPYVVVEKKQIGTQEAFEEKIKETLKLYKIDLIVLAGFLSILSEKFVKDYDKKIINVHPSLIPSFCGKGYYGLKVHEEVLKKGVKITGATVHYVNEIPDDGEIILQKAVKVYKNDTPEKLQKRVMQQAEWKILPKAVEIVSKKILKEKNYGYLQD